MATLALIILILGAALLAIAPALASPPRPGGAPTTLSKRLREAARQADKLPLVGAEIRRTRRRKLHAQVRDRLPTFWGDVAIYLREGRQDLRGAIAAAIDRLEDPLSTTLGRHLRVAQLGQPLDDALRQAAAELGYEEFSDGIEDLLATEVDSSLPQVLEELQDQAIERMSVERREKAATLETRLIVLLWPLLFLALMLAIFIPLVVSGLDVLLGF